MGEFTLIDISRVHTPHINTNDCWALVLSKVSGKSYNDIYTEMIEKGYADDKGFHNTYINTVLKQYGYYPVYLLIPRQKARIRHILEAYYKYEIVIGSMSIKKNLPHLSYAHKGVDYTTSETDDSLDDPVLYLWVKDS